MGPDEDDGARAARELMDSEEEMGREKGDEEEEAGSGRVFRVERRLRA